MIDRSFGDHGPMLRSPDLRIGDVRTAVLHGAAPFTHRNAQTGRGTLVYLLAGDFSLEIDGSDQGPHRFREGTALGFEDGRAHALRALGPAGTKVALLVSSIPIGMSVLRSLRERFMAVPPEATPYATTIRLAVDLHLHGHLSATAEDDIVIRRCAEICLAQFVNYIRAVTIAAPDAPAGLAHDAHMLRAWTAYLANPRRRWTVAALAEAAGLGRTVFAERFRTVFGQPPLLALTEMRLEQALRMLRETRAPLGEIAFVSGYGSEAAFVRAFRRRYHTTPGACRTPCAE